MTSRERRGLQNIVRGSWQENITMVPRRGVRSYLAMDDDAKRIARRALEEAQAAGKGYMEQTEAAVRALRVARPELTAPVALAVVNLVRRS